MADQSQRAAASTPRVLGVDDFAFRRRCRYGTVLVDMEQHRPVDLLPDREAKSLEGWLNAHPGVEIVCRDRSTVYTEAVTKAAPNAVQVADRWHLVKNLNEALMRFFDQQQTAVKQAAPLLACAEGALPVVWPPTKGAAALEERRDHRGQRLARYEQVRALHRQGVPLRAIARQLGLARGTVNRYAACEAFPEIARHKPQPTSLDPFKPYLHRRWSEGCHHASQLYREIQAQGFSGTSSWLARYLTGLRRAPPVPAAEARAPSARSVAAMVVRRRDELSSAERAFLERIQHASEPIRNVCKLADRFLAMVRLRRQDLLPAWLVGATESDSSSLAGFARGLRQDLAAVEAALSLAWSNGPTEGQVNRLKLVKRSMYGRAGFALLKARVLPLSA
jgi:transposase